MLIAIEEQLRMGRPESARALCVQCIKSVHQFVLSDGQHETSWLLTSLVDPNVQQQFAGTAAEMSIIAAYQKAMSELRKKVTHPDKEEDVDEAPGEEGDKKGKRQGKKN